MLAFFSISMGLWENFRGLWLQDNNFTVTGISNIISVGTLISVIGIALVGKYIKLHKLKRFLIYTLIVKFINILILLYLNNTRNYILINISIIIDVLAGYLITTSIYPLITMIIKNNTIYSILYVIHNTTYIISFKNKEFNFMPNFSFEILKECRKM